MKIEVFIVIGAKVRKYRVELFNFINFKELLNYSGLLILAKFYKRFFC